MVPKMKEILIIAQKLSGGQEAAAGGGGGAGGGVRTDTKHKVTPGIPGWLNEVGCQSSKHHMKIEVQ